MFCCKCNANDKKSNYSSFLCAMSFDFKIMIIWQVTVTAMIYMLNALNGRERTIVMFSTCNTWQRTVKKAVDCVVSKLYAAHVCDFAPNCSDSRIIYPLHTVRYLESFSRLDFAVSKKKKRKIHMNCILFDTS